MSQEAFQSVEDSFGFDLDSSNSEEDYPPIKDDLPIHKAAAKGDISSLRFLVASNVDIDIRNEDERTPLHLAIHGNHAEAVRMLLSAGADPAQEEVKPCYQQRYSAINLAAFIGSQAALAVLIDHDAGISARSLYLAASVNRVECIDTILRKLGQRDFSDSPRLVGVRDALNRAAMCLHFDTVNFFLTRVEGFPDKGSKEDQECLGHAIYFAAHEYDCDDRCRWSEKLRAEPRLQYKMMDNLIAASGDVDIEVPQYWMPQATFEFLLQNGLRVDHATDGKHTSLFSIIDDTNIDISLVETFLDRGAKATITDTELNTPLHFAAHRSFADLLLKHGANLSSRNVEGKTPLYSACEGGRFDVANFLVANGASIGETTNDGRTALHAAASRNDTELIRYLIEQGADIEARDKTRAMPLYLSYPRGSNAEAFNLLLQKGGNRHTADNEGKTVLDLIDQEKWRFNEQGLLQAKKAKPQPQFVSRKAISWRGRRGGRGGGHPRLN